MEFLVEVIFRGLIIRVFGVYYRYYYFIIIGKPKTIFQLSGNKEKVSTSFSQDFYNALIGLIVFCLLSIGIAFLIFTI